MYVLCTMKCALYLRTVFSHLYPSQGPRGYKRGKNEAVGFERKGKLGCECYLTDKTETAQEISQEHKNIKASIVKREAIEDVEAFNQGSIETHGTVE